LVEKRSALKRFHMFSWVGGAGPSEGSGPVNSSSELKKLVKLVNSTLVLLVLDDSSLFKEGDKSKSLVKKSELESKGIVIESEELTSELPSKSNIFDAAGEEDESSSSGGVLR
jgi:hypothetical protein